MFHTEHAIEALQAAGLSPTPRKVARTIRGFRRLQSAFNPSPRCCGICDNPSRVKARGGRLDRLARYSLDNPQVEGHRLYLCTGHAGTRFESAGRD